MLCRNFICRVRPGRASMTSTGRPRLRSPRASQNDSVPVFGLLDAPALDGVRPCPDPETAVGQVARVVLALPRDD